MAGEINSVVSVEQLLGGELASAAEEILVGARLGAFDPAHAVSLATAQILLALYWELRHQDPGVPDPGDSAGQPEGAHLRCTSREASLGWMSALLCSGQLTGSHSVAS